MRAAVERREEVAGVERRARVKVLAAVAIVVVVRVVCIWYVAIVLIVVQVRYESTTLSIVVCTRCLEVLEKTDAQSGSVEHFYQVQPEMCCVHEK